MRDPGETPVVHPPAAGVGAAVGWSRVPRYELWAPAVDVLPLVTHAVYAVEHDPRVPVGAGLVLVQDDGLYLCSTGLPHRAAADGSARQEVVHLRAPRGRVLSAGAPLSRYTGRGDDWVVVWELDDDDPARTAAAVASRGRVVVRFGSAGPTWRPEPGRWSGRER